MKRQNAGESISQSDADSAARVKPTALRTRMEIVLREAAIIAVLGALFGFVANAVSPRGLALARNYFPIVDQGIPPSNNVAISARRPTETNSEAPSRTNLLATQLLVKGLQLVESDHVHRLFGNPRCEQDLIVFIDARDDQHYQDGHIPGAYQFNHYRPENYLGTILPVCQKAEQIVVYCTGGDCEDSEFAAIFLRDAGIAKEKLFVYAGGMTEWIAKGFPVEIGNRKSGNFRPNSP